jgi:hypothetical protein
MGELRNILMLSKFSGFTALMVYLDCTATVRYAGGNVFDDGACGCPFCNRGLWTQVPKTNEKTS